MASHAPRPDWSAVPAERSSRVSLRSRQRLIVGGVLAAAAAGPLALLLTLASGSSAQPAADGGSLSTAHAYARIVAQDYLAGRSTVVPVARNINPTMGHSNDSPSLSVQAMTDGAVQAGVDGSQSYSVHHFTVQTSGRLFDLAVTMVQGANGPVLGAHPSLLAVGGEPGTVPAMDYGDSPDKINGAPDGPLVEQVNKWAAAYAAGDSDSLKALVDGAGTYLGLGGFKVDGAAAVVNSVENQDGTVVVRAKVPLVAASNPALTFYAEYDLLVQPDGELPKVLAWGPAGSGPTLQPYQNNTAG